MATNPINLQILRVELARRGMTRLALARELDVKATTLSAWLRRVNPQPADLAGLIESKLRLPGGFLTQDVEELTTSMQS
jgi:transcriptional regulator with XRE-family HTH domain